MSQKRACSEIKCRHFLCVVFTLHSIGAWRLCERPRTTRDETELNLPRNLSLRTVTVISMESVLEKIIALSFTPLHMTHQASQKYDLHAAIGGPVYIHGCSCRTDHTPSSKYYSNTDFICARPPRARMFYPHSIFTAVPAEEITHHHYTTTPKTR